MGKEAVAIGHLERFAADYERESGQISVPEVGEKTVSKWLLSVPVLPDYPLQGIWPNTDMM